MSRILFIVSISIGNASAQDHPDLRGLITLAESSYANISGYACKMHRTEFVGGKYKTQTNILIKYRKPDSFYLKWTEGQGKGSESLYIKGQNGGKMLVHLPGIYKFLVFSMAPDGKRALKNNRHSIEQLQFGFFIEMIRNNLTLANGDPDVRLIFNGEATLDGARTLEYTGLFPSGGGYYGQKVNINISLDSYLPIRIEVYDGDRMLESYRFTDLVLNPAFKDTDFSPDNPEYGFKGRKVYALD